MAEAGLYPEQIKITQSEVARMSLDLNRRSTSFDAAIPGLTEQRLTKALVLVEDAIAGRKYYTKDDMISMKRSLIYHHWTIQALIKVLVLTHVGLAFVEWPQSIDIFKSKYTDIIVMGMIEMGILGLYAFEMLWKRSFIELKKTSVASNKNYWITWACIGLTLLDVILGMIIQGHYVRWSRFIRPWFVLYYFPSVRHYFKNLKNSLPDILHVFAVLFGLIFFFVLLLDVLLETDNDPGFPNTFRSFLSLYILSTTANFPDVMVYSVTYVSPFFAFIFVIYCVCVTKIMLSLFTAVIYNRYQYYISKDVDKLRQLRNKKLTNAFECLDVKGTGILTVDEWCALLKVLRPSYSEDKILLLFRIIDENGSHDLKLREFKRIVSLLRLNITAQSADAERGDNYLARKFPGFYRSRFFFFLKKIVLSKAFGWSMDLVVVASAVRIVLFKEVTFSLTTKTVTESVLLAMYVGEAVLKLVVLGTGGYWASHWNKFDSILIITSVVSTIITLLPGFSSQMIVRVVLLLRIVRLFRLGRTSANVRSLYMTMWRLIPTFVMHALALMIVYYEFALLGMLLWGGLIYDGNPLLNGSSFQAIYFYKTSNFNTFGNAILTLFELMIQNNWHVIADAYERVSNPWAWLYFIFYNISTAVVIINILVAFILDGFITQWKVVQLQIKTKVQIRIEELAQEQAAAAQTRAQQSDPAVSGSATLEENPLDKMEKFLGEEENTEQNVIWTASDTSFKIDPLEFAEDEDEADEK